LWWAVRRDREAAEPGATDHAAEASAVVGRHGVLVREPFDVDVELLVR
jgi:hypothetical protein